LRGGGAGPSPGKIEEIKIFIYSISYRKKNLLLFRGSARAPVNALK